MFYRSSKNPDQNSVVSGYLISKKISTGKSNFCSKKGSLITFFIRGQTNIPSLHWVSLIFYSKCKYLKPVWSIALIELLVRRYFIFSGGRNSSSGFTKSGNKTFFWQGLSGRRFFWPIFFGKMPYSISYVTLAQEAVILCVTKF